MGAPGVSPTLPPAALAPGGTENSDTTSLHPPISTLFPYATLFRSKLVWKVIPDETTRLAALKRREVDIAYSIRGELAEEVQHTPGLTLKPVHPPAPVWPSFFD